MFKEVNLEISMKAFKKNTPEYIEKVVKEIFDGWAALLKGRERISVLFWVADGSEILDYTGDMEKEIEWAYLAGTANNPTLQDGEDRDVNLHKQNVKYIKNPPKVTYRVIKNIIDQIKSEGKKLYPKSEIRVGIPFDIGPEFSRSEFKYKRHPEICTGSGEGVNTFVNSYGLLNKDDYPYAGFPKGIPQDTPFGKVLGRQADLFMKALGFDYLWLSNGVGFSATPWKSTGDIFDGEKFHTDKFQEVQDKVFGFWEIFRKECPDYPVYTRGTNFSAGVDYAVDAVGLHKIYNSSLNIIPPPNSPWAALNGNYGLELMGHLTRNCELPSEDFMFRFYLHDPWWVNSPWYDRYNQSAHDIYLPMALSRIDEKGKTQAAGILNILTVDNTFGDMPESCVYETVPHLMKAEKDSADAPAPFVWVYPFREYTTVKQEGMLKKILSGDLFICRAITNGFPLSSVVSCDNFMKHTKDIYYKSVLVTPVPEKDSAFEKEITGYVEAGGKVMFYGNIDNASQKFLNMFGITPVLFETDTVSVASDCPDETSNGDAADTMIIRRDICGTKMPKDKKLSAQYKNSVWYYAPIEIQSFNYDTHDKKNIDSPKESVWGTVYLREVLKSFGYDISFTKPFANSKVPIIMINKSNNADIFSVYTPDQTVETSLKFPLGAPILDGYEAELKDGAAHYRFSKCVHKECRVYVEQQNGVVGVTEMAPVSMKYRRRIAVTGLENATVRLFAEDYCKDDFNVKIGAYPDRYASNQPVDGEIVNSKEYGTYFEARNVTGNIVFSMEYKK